MAVLHNSVINFFTFLDSYISNKLRYDFKWVEYIISKALYERHDKGVFCGLFGLNHVFHFGNAVAKLLYLVFKIHIVLVWLQCMTSLLVKKYVVLRISKS